MTLVVEHDAVCSSEAVTSRMRFDCEPTVCDQVRVVPLATAVETTKKIWQRYDAKAEEAGYTAGPQHHGYLGFVHVASGDVQCGVMLTTFAAKNHHAVRRASESKRAGNFL